MLSRSSPPFSLRFALRKTTTTTTTTCPNSPTRNRSTTATTTSTTTKQCTPGDTIQFAQQHIQNDNTWHVGKKIQFGKWEDHLQPKGDDALRDRDINLDNVARTTRKKGKGKAVEKSEMVRQKKQKLDIPTVPEPTTDPFSSSYSPPSNRATISSLSLLSSSSSSSSWPLSHRFSPPSPSPSLSPSSTALFDENRSYNIIECDGEGPEDAEGQASAQVAPGRVSRGVQVGSPKVRLGGKEKRVLGEDEVDRMIDDVDWEEDLRDSPPPPPPKSILPASRGPLTSTTNSIHPIRPYSTTSNPTKNVIEIESSDDELTFYSLPSSSSSSSDIEILPPSRSSPLPKSGWFVRPPSLRPLPHLQPQKQKRPYSALSQAAKKREKNAQLRSKYEQDFTMPKVVRVVYTTKEEVVDSVLGQLEGPLGFDLEWDVAWKGQKENKTALVQVCDRKTVLLVHVARMGKIPSSLKKLIEDPDRIKLGVAIKGDGAKLTRDFSHAPLGLLELSKCAKVADRERWKEYTPSLVSLQNLCGIYLDRYLRKEEGVRCGKWSGTLGEEQREYAACDVYASLMIYLRLRDLSDPGIDLPSLRTGIHVPNPSSSYTRTLSKTLRPRQLEAYDLWHKESLTIAQVSERMGVSPLTVVWNVLSVVGKEEVEYEKERLWRDLEGVQGPSKERMLSECKEVVQRLKKDLGKL